jgi:oligopeptide/dipeptide ABC transporter ATP-binding protein
VNQKPLIDIRNLSVHFVSRRGLVRRRTRTVRAVDDVSLTIQDRETLGVVGESGCGKTTLGRAILRLVNATHGQVLVDSEDVLQLRGEALRRRRRDMQMVFQNPHSSFDPRFSILNVVAEPLITHTDLRGEALTARAAQVLQQVGMPGEILFRYPHEFSGGQLQRIAVARALALNPKFLVLDEPTSALDVSVQAQIINLLQDLQLDFKLTYLFISHDLSVVQHISDRIAVMYLGKVVELSNTQAIFSGYALHPYTQALLSSVPMVEPSARRERIILQGSVPNPADPPGGCPFHPRCPVAMHICSRIAPALQDAGDGHMVSCHLVYSQEKNSQKSSESLGKS